MFFHISLSGSHIHIAISRTTENEDTHIHVRFIDTMSNAWTQILQLSLHVCIQMSQASHQELEHSIFFLVTLSCII